MSSQIYLLSIGAPFFSPPFLYFSPLHCNGLAWDLNVGSPPPVPGPIRTQDIETDKWKGADGWGDVSPPDCLGNERSTSNTAAGSSADRLSSDWLGFVASVRRISNLKASALGDLPPERSRVRIKRTIKIQPFGSLTHWLIPLSRVNMRNTCWSKQVILLTDCMVLKCCN